MPLIFLFFAFSCLLQSEDSKPPQVQPTVEQLQVRISELEAELLRVKTSSAFELRICNGAVQAARDFFKGGPEKPIPQRIQPHVPPPSMSSKQ